jgi:hypothetical protein
MNNNDDQTHEEAARAAEAGIEDSRYVDPVEDATWAHERRCDCPLCDSVEEAGCPHRGTVLVGKTWMCPACANSVAATRGLQVTDAS